MAMRPIISTIDGLLQGGSKRTRWSLVVISVMTLGVVHLSGRNQNLLLLSMLFAVQLILSLILSRVWLLVLGHGIILAIGCRPLGTRELHFLEPSPHGPPDSPWYSVIPQGERWNYRFFLRDLATHGSKEKLTGWLHINGIHLADLEISIQGRPLVSQPPPKIPYTIEYLAIPIDSGNETEMRISLRAKPGTAPKIFCGPEVYGYNMYSDAVWLEFMNDRESVLYHAKRATGSATAP